MKHLKTVINFITAIPNSVLASLFLIIMCIDHGLNKNFSYAHYLVVFFAILVISICELCESIVNALKDNDE